MSSIEFLFWMKKIETPVLTGVFKAFSYAGSDILYVMIVAWLYWCIDKKTGVKWAQLVFTSAILNSFIKVKVGAIRPFTQYPQLEPLAVDTATGYSFPSGHSQAAASFGTFVALENKNRILKALGFALLIIMGISRLYLRVHWPIDVIGGWIIGMFLATIFHFLYNVFGNLFAELLVPLIGALYFVYPDESHTKIIALYIATMIGFRLNDHYQLSVHLFGEGGKRKLMLGIASIIFTELGMKHIMHEVFPLLRYVTLGLMMTFIFPFIFEKLYNALKKN